MNGERPLILLVEDHAVMGQMLARFLRERGEMEIWGLVETAEAALEKLEAAVGEGPARSNHGANELPDLALVDVSLPGMSGLDFVVEASVLYPALPCLMVSAHRDPGYVRQALANGARGYVAKGDPPAIVDAVRQVLAGKVYVGEGLRE